ncbi:GNAT family N-acetyltransferase [Lapidilactobacillus luobeiensis]|uniref:GNAT family N-acetyltransferase n=1 Tax=Lapidilactobacillus luobeiensis TaxID=2950371 RepID=UPI0021C4A714|nr:GNAT family N-acetyltransferase [Lapidilactobacillus luobeiensis]
MKAISGAPIRFRQAQTSDLPAMLAIIQAAQQRLGQQGIPQWQDGYPDATVLGEDLRQQAAWVAVNADDQVLLTLTLLAGPDPHYQKIAGAWLTSTNDYLVIHRIAVSPQAAHQGVAAAGFDFAKRQAQRLKLGSIRIDTHAQNQAMRALIKKMGYQACGQIWVAADAPRLAYELVVKS